MARVLGLSFHFHDSAAALVDAGRVVAAAAEERFTRRKHTSEFPRRAIDYCLDAGGLTSINDLDAIVFYEKPLRKMLRVVETFVTGWPHNFEGFTARLPDYLKGKVNLVKLITNELPGYAGPVLFSEHHLSHAASACLCSPFEECAVLTVDGVGEAETTTIGAYRDGSLRLDRAIHFPHSVGLFYSALTAYLGFSVNDAEWKVMGLAPYGRPVYVDKMRRMMRIHDDGSFALDLRYFAHHYSTRLAVNAAAWEALLGFPRRFPDEDLQPHHQDLARSGQAVVEEMILALAAEASRATGSRNLAIAGGVGLNSVANWRLEQSGLFDRVWIQPAAGDDGAALGAALAVSHLRFGDPRPPELKDVYLGPAIDDDEVAAYCAREGLASQRLPDDALVDAVARLIDAGRVVGWARGRMEFGPRSLGARSILASPRTADMKALINEKVKYREYFRPFAPAVPIEHAHEYFDVEPGTALPFMLKIPAVRPEARHLIPAVTHEDGSARVQTVESSVNPAFHQLLCRVGELTGVPVLLNTSFNVRGEPVVCTIDDVYRCFVRTGLDALVLGQHLIVDKPTAPLTPAEGYAESDRLERGDTSVSRSVARFYQRLPFNVYSNPVEFAAQIMSANRLKEYPPLYRHLRREEDLRILDVGSGGGWFVHSCAAHTPHRVVGLERNPVALRQAEAVARLLPDRSRIEFVRDDLYDYAPSQPFDVVNSLGVLHHTEDCLGGLRRIAQWVRPGGYLHLGLYHRYGRAPFLDYFAKLKADGAGPDVLRRAFADLLPDAEDDVHLESWFRDQVLHPHETQHTLAEVASVLREQGFTIAATSFDNFKKRPDVTALISREHTWQQRAERALAERRYYPGYFVVWAHRG